jgi:methionine synthase II (cobalamin-independent)
MKGIDEMNTRFTADCRVVLIGSLPLKDHREAIGLVAQYSPEIPLWVQLPANPAEGMIRQFIPGLPGLSDGAREAFVDTESEGFDESLLDFYAEYLAVTESGASLDLSRFALTSDVARGFFEFVDYLHSRDKSPVAVKGQVTGPITLTTAVKDGQQKAIFYNGQLRDAAVKLISLKAAFQVKTLSRFKAPVIIFIDEPALAGFGSSEFTSISKGDVTACLEEVIGAVHEAGGLAGIHVCANTDWSIILESSVDIVNFDAYSYFDRFVLYPDHIKTFIGNGNMIAWGIVPTAPADALEMETTASLVKKYDDQVKALERWGIDREVIFSRSFITPSCGTGSLRPEQALKALELTRSVSETLRNRTTG